MPREHRISAQPAPREDRDVAASRPRARRRMPAALRLIHPAPALAVIALSAALAMIMARAAGESPVGPQVALTVLAVAGSQILTGALNDWSDRDLDRDRRPDKPIPAGELAPRTALVIAAGGLTVQVAASTALGPLALALGVGASASATAYNLWLSRTPASVLPYLVSFGLLPAWIAAGVGLSLERVAGATLLTGPLAASAHLANVLRDWEADRALGSRNLAQVIGRRRAHLLAVILALGVAIAVGVALASTGRLDALTAALGGVGLLAVGLGAASPRRLWPAIQVAAVAWTVAWGLATFSAPA